MLVGHAIRRESMRGRKAWSYRDKQARHGPQWRGVRRELKLCDPGPGLYDHSSSRREREKQVEHTRDGENTNNIHSHLAILKYTFLKLPRRGKPVRTRKYIRFKAAPARSNTAVLTAKSRGESRQRLLTPSMSHNAYDTPPFTTR